MTKEEYLKGLILQRWTTERFRRKNQYAIWNSIFHSEKCRWRIYVQYSKNLQWPAHFH